MYYQIHAKYVSMRRRGEPYLLNVIFSKVFKFQYYSIAYLDAINDVITICDRYLVPNFWQRLQRLEGNNVRLKKEKCKFSHNQVVFCGHIFSAEGIQADPTKITAIKETQPPTNTGEVPSHLGMAQYVSRFHPQYATITAPLRMLTPKDVPWCWDPEQQHSFNRLKEVLTGSQVMA